MKKRILIAGVALVFAGAAWAGGGKCNFGSHENIVGPGLVLTSPHEDPGFFLVEWEIVEDAAFYVIYCEVLQTDEIEPVAEWVRMETVDAVPGQKQLSTVVELPDDDVNAVFGVAAGTRFPGNPRALTYHQGALSRAGTNGRGVDELGAGQDDSRQVACRKLIADPAGFRSGGIFFVPLPPPDLRRR